MVYDPQRRRTRTAGKVAHELGAAEVLDVLAYRSVVEPGAAELAARNALDADARSRLTDACAVAVTGATTARTAWPTHACTC